MPRAPPALSSSEPPAVGIPVSHPVHGLCEFCCSFITLIKKGLAGPGHVFLIPQKILTGYVPMSILQRARGPEGICSCLKSLSEQVANSGRAYEPAHEQLASCLFYRRSSPP